MGVGERMVDIEQAIAALKAGAPAVFPTDTVYGIGVAVRYAPSPQALYDIKKRDAGKPIAWLVGGVEALDEYGVDVAQEARALAEAYWPGALTLIVKASNAVPAAFLPAAGTIGLRMPASEVALALVHALGPLATSSANLSGGPDPRAFADLEPKLLEQVAAAICSDRSNSGVASTVVDCSKGEARVVRQGAILPASGL